MATNSRNTLQILSMIIMLSYPNLCFKILDCGNSKTRNINVTQNNKNVVEYDNQLSKISVESQDRVELWCETDCWFSECTLTHYANDAHGCESNEVPYGSQKIVEDYEEFESSKKHICKFVIERHFSCQGKLHHLKG